MAKRKKEEAIWLDVPAKEDFASAERYLGLLFKSTVAQRLVQRLRKAHKIEYPAKDLLRASQTHLLDSNNPEVESDLKKIKKHKKVSPVLLVRGKGAIGTTLTIADGYHRICASWHWDEKMAVACRLVDLID